MYKTIALLLITIAIISCKQYHYEGAAVGAAIGGVSGALIDKNNHWRGGLIGAGIGSIAGATISEISAKATKDVVSHNYPVEYRTNNGQIYYRAEPYTYYDNRQNTTCKKIRERLWENDRLIKDTVKEVCHGEKQYFDY